ncbi:unnamed protein product [Oikopleura dioica]|uniref:Aminomethyltransferase n=1 Tax=Oikopleura dioica TaxID=34765 RepID=E4WUF6_OIKDI|nr:unnamed protein product [Oikopleura dioica]
MRSSIFRIPARYLRKTPLWNLHKEKNATMAEFAGFDMPMIYKVISHTRTACSIFDVSHMLQTRITGESAIAAIESVCTADVAALSDNSGSLALFTNQQGGILDDLIVNKISSEEIYVVSNASMAEQDFAILKNAAEIFDCKLEKIETALIAVQGPKAAELLQKGTSLDLSKLSFMQGADLTLFGTSGIRATRCGYTGEDGFELSIPAEAVETITKQLIEDGALMAGLGARDTLRLEAGLCLYGNDIDETTLPPSAVLLFTVPKSRRAQGNFPGCAEIVKQQKTKPEEKRVGLIFQKGKPPARQGAELFNDGEKIGRVTSGGPSPTLGRNIGMGYVPLELTKPGTKLQVKVRKNIFDAEVTKMPFVKCNYFTAKNE